MAQSSTDMGAAAMAWYDAGFSPIKAHLDGSKRPMGSRQAETGKYEWKQWHAARPSRAEVWEWFRTGHPALGIVCGGPSRVVALDFDQKGLLEKFKERAAAWGLDQLLARFGYQEHTPNGAHLFFMQPLGAELLHSQGLAYAADGNKKILETRAHLGFCIVAPSHDCHESGRPYVALRGTPDDIPVLTEAQTGDLLRLCASFDERVDPPADTWQEPQKKGGNPWDNIVSVPEFLRQPDRPGDLFNAEKTWQDVLVGWVPVFTSEQGVTHWRRPGKKPGTGWSATTNHHGWDLLYVFTTSTPLVAERGYTKFSAHTMLHHGGDFSAAARVYSQARNKEQSASLIVRDSLRRRKDSVEAHANTGAPPKIRSLSDLGNAGRFFDQNINQVLYVSEARAWYVYTGKVWRRDLTKATQKRAARIAESIHEEVAGARDEAERLTIARWAHRSESRASIENLLVLSQAMLSVASEELDSPKGSGWLLNCGNGTLDLRTGTLRPHDPRQRLTKLVDVDYDPKAECPRWERFLEEIFLGNEDLIHFVWKALGYSLTGDCSEQCFFLLHGHGQNGKSVFLSILQRVLSDYASQTTGETWVAHRQEGVRNDIAALKGARLVSSPELPQRRINEELLKQVTGSDTLTSRFLYGEYFSFVPELKLWMACNELPALSTSYGIWRRVNLIPFNYTVEHPDPHLGDALDQERAGILSWMVRGCFEWQANRLHAPGAVADATASYRNDSDILGLFLSECCILDREVTAGATTLYQLYREWAEEQGETGTMTQNKFGRDLRARGLDSIRSTITGKRLYRGVGIKIGAPVDAPPVTGSWRDG